MSQSSESSQPLDLRFSQHMSTHCRFEEAQGSYLLVLERGFQYKTSWLSSRLLSWARSMEDTFSPSPCTAVGLLLLLQQAHGHWLRLEVETVT